MPSVAPLFLEGEKYTSKLYLVNPLSFGVQVSVTLYDMSGAALTTKQLYMSSNTQTSLSIRQVLSDANITSEAGSIEVISPQTAAPMLGQLSITRSGSKTAYLDEELYMPSEDGSQTLRSVIDSPENSPVVAMTNISTTTTQTVHVTCVTTSSIPIERILTIQPKQTVLSRVCSSSDASPRSSSSIDQGFTLVQDSKAGMAGQGAAGISLVTEGPAGDLAAFGFVEHKDIFGAYFSAATFYDPKALLSSGFIFAGVPVGMSRLLPSVTYTPQLAVTNFSSSPQVITASSAVTNDGLAHLTQLATLTIPPSSSRMVPLGGMSSNLDWQNSFIVHSTGLPGDVISKMMFKSSSSLPNIELVGKDEDHLSNAGDHPWSVENGMRSILVLFNYGTSAKEVTVRIASGMDIWLKIYTLQPNETRTISINKILRARLPDMNGHVLSATLLNGELGWWAPSSGPPRVTGRVVQLDPSGTMARNFSCPSVNGLCDITMSLSSLLLTTDDPEGIGGSPTYCEYQAPPTGCPNDNLSTPTQASLNWSWTSANTNIAQITSGATTSSSMWMGMTPGSTTSSLTARVQSNSNNFCQTSDPVYTKPSITYSNLKDLALASAGATGAITSNQVTASGNPGGGTYSWTISNSNVSITNATSATVTTTAAAAGTSALTVTYTVNGQSNSATGTINVFQPSQVSIVSDTGVTATNICYTGANQYNGPARVVNYQVQANQNGTVVPVTATVSLSESFTPLSSPPPSCGAAPTPTQNLLTTQTFKDNFNYCSTYCLPVKSSAPQGACTLALQHVWTANGFTIFNHTLTYTCTNITPQ